MHCIAQVIREQFKQWPPRKNQPAREQHRNLDVGHTQCHNGFPSIVTGAQSSPKLLSKSLDP